MTSAKQVGRIATFGLGLAAGLLIASGGGGGVASASTGDIGHSATSSATSGNGPSTHAAPSHSARTHGGPATKSTARPSTSVAHPSAVSHATSAVSQTAGNATQLVTTRVNPASAVSAPVQAGLEAAARQLEALVGGFQQAIQNNINGLRQTLQSDVAGIVDAHWTPFAPKPPTPPVATIPDPVIYGNPAKNAQYWEKQTGNTCVLMSVAMVIGQLTGNKIPMTQIVKEASAIDSGVGPGKIYTRAENKYVFYSDALQLLKNHGIDATYTYYTKGQGTRALSNIETALGQGQSVIVAIHATVAWNSFEGLPLPMGFIQSNHAVTVLGIDATNKIVYLNDTGVPYGQNMALPLSDFLTAWQASKYLTITAQLATPVADSVPPTQADLALAA